MIINPNYFYDIYIFLYVYLSDNYNNLVINNPGINYIIHIVLLL